nr:uncharacterized protein LOC124811479 isoform X2 [Hydra vulgaris]XP_047133091.1 uncharacterized protein LOC124811479 isoform X2 [Hydra vulgaris]XP_047133092.1 uncharacterized protein LOC124811479 isoform X2 [Hydra vulgaris]
MHDYTLRSISMAPNFDAVSLPCLNKCIELGTHQTFSLSDYVVIHLCKPPCIECEFINISSKQALQIILKEEKMKNERYREKIIELSKRYEQSRRKVKNQKLRIEQLSKQLQTEQKKTSENDIEKFVVINLDTNH